VDAIKINRLDPGFCKEIEDKMLQEDKKANINYCLSCTTCATNCPFNDVHSNMYPRIFMRKLILGMKEDIFKDPFVWNCTACGCCTMTCPMGINIAAIVRTTRGEINYAKGFDFFHKLFYRGILSHQERLKIVGALVSFYDRSGARWMLRKSGVLNAFEKIKNMENILPLGLKPSLRSQLSKILKQVDQHKFKIGYFAGCATNTFFSEIGKAAILYLQHRGCQVEIPEIQCCGGPHRSAGDLQEAKRLAKDNLEIFLKGEFDYIISDCATCGSTLKEYQALFKNDHAMKKKAQQFSEKILDLNKFIVDFLYCDENLNILNKKVTYHDPCHLARGLEVTKEPRELLKSIPGVQFIEMKDADWCCGGAGSYCFTQQEMSAKILAVKITNFIETGAEVLATSCPACTMQLSAGLRKKGIKADVKHPVQILAESSGVIR